VIGGGRFLQASCGGSVWLGGGWASCVRAPEFRDCPLAAAASADGNGADARGVEDHGCECSGRTGRRGRPPARGGTSASVASRRPRIESWTGRAPWLDRRVMRGFVARLGKKKNVRVCVGRCRADDARGDKWCFWRMDRDGQAVLQSLAGQAARNGQVPQDQTTDQN
jgi:hypothetical protein